MSNENDKTNETKIREAMASAISVTPPLPAPAPKKNIQRVFALSQDAGDAMAKAGYTNDDTANPLLFALQQATGTSTAKKAPSLAFTENPAAGENYAGLTKSKRKLLPDDVLKIVRVEDHLVAGILRARGSHVSLFGHLRKDRFDVGIELAIKKEFEKILTPEQYETVVKRMKEFEQILLNCGHTAGLEHQDRTTLASFLDVQTRNGLTFGRFATEIIYDRDGKPDKDGKFPFNRFRARDVGTIEAAVRKGEAVGKGMRAEAMRLLAQMSGDGAPTIDMSKLEEDQFAWIQKIDGLPRQGFTHDEMIVYNLFESTDIEHNGYPVSPLDTVVKSVTTHISIDTYKMLYFQNGRASRGMLVIQSDEVDEQVIEGIKIQFNAAINNVSNSFRTPIFGMGKEDKVEWLSMAGEGAQDRDFQFMYDQVARNILSAFSISPDELPGYSHLSRGTNSQTLSESNNEFKLTAARDTGIRPLILKFQTYFNQFLFPLIDPLLSQICDINFCGLDAQSKEQESTRLQQDMPTHMSMDDVLKEVDKDPVGQTMGGVFQFNERYQLILDKYLNVGEVTQRFMGRPGDLVDPILAYKRDPFFLQYMQLLAQANPSAVMAYFAPKPHAMEFLMMEIQDQLDGEENT